MLPRLLSDAENAPPLLRSQAYQLAGSVMVQTRNRDAARIALNRSLADAEATDDLLGRVGSYHLVLGRADRRGTVRGSPATGFGVG